MKLFKKGVAIVLTIGILSTLCSFGTKSDALRGETLTSLEMLTVNDMVSPVGTDKNVSFGWRMVSQMPGQKQTAYQITVSENENLSAPVWDSGRVESDISQSIPYAGEALKSSAEYHWQVKAWDKDGQTVSAQSEFETGLLGANAWSDSQWIKRGSSTVPTSGDVNYTVEADVQIGCTGVALLFEAKDAQNFLMWQLRNTDGRMVLRPHYRSNGNFTVLGETDLTAKASGGLSGVQHLKLIVTKQSVVTEFNGEKVSTVTADKLGGVGLSGGIGRLGFRSDYFETENGWIDNLKLTDYALDENGTVVKNYTFEDGINPFTSGSIDGGRLNTAYTPGAENVGLEKSGEEPVHYTVEADVTSEDTAISIVFGAKDTKNFYMWQFNIIEQPGRVLFRPHTCTDGNYAVLNGNVRDITDLVGGADNFAKTPAHVKIEVNENIIKTYIGGELVDTLTAAAPLIVGQLGTRNATTETGTIDNLKLTQDGKEVYNYTFDSENPFVVGEIKNGVYLSNGNRGVILPPKGIDTYRKEFISEVKPASAKFYITGFGVFDAYINGERAGRLNPDGTTTYDELKPGYTQLTKHVFYLAYDVTHLISEGANTVSANVSPGWWGGRNFQRGADTALRAKLILTYENGETRTIGTDKTWKTSLEGPVLSADIYDGELYNANADISYRENGYDDSAWCYADTVSKTVSIIPHIGEPVRVRDDLELTMKSATVYNGVTDQTASQHGKINVTGTYKSGEAFTVKAGEKAVIDMGQNFAGWGEIDVTGEKGTVVTMRHGEMLNDRNGLKSRGNDGAQGSIYTANLRSAQATAKYVLSGAQSESYHSTHTFYGFRYIELSADRSVRINGVKGVVVTSVNRDTGFIETGDADVNQLISNIKWGQYSNYLSIPTDCPQRDERQGWTADTQVFSTAAAYNADSKNFLRKYMMDMRDSQAANGEFPDTAPYTGYGESGQLGWGDAGIVIPYNLYKMYGDKQIVEENYAAMQKFMDVFMASTNKNGGGHNHADWLAYEPKQPISTLNTLYGIAYYAWDAQMMSEMAAVLGKTDDVKKYQQVYETEKEYFNKKYVNADGSLKRSEQTACLMALKMDLLPDENSRELVKQQLIKNIVSKGSKLQTGFLGTAIIMQTLSDADADDMAYTLLMQDGDPSWLYSVKQGATTIWERWNSYTVEKGFGPVDMNSFNHYAYGAVAEWMFGYMAGIGYDFAHPGFKHIVLNPTPDKSVGYVNCSYDSVYGNIVSNWKYEGDRVAYETTVPANTTADLTVPAAEENLTSIFVNGKEVSVKGIEQGAKLADGVTYLGVSDGRVQLSLQPGAYSFKEGENESVHMTGVALDRTAVSLKLNETAHLTASAVPADTTDKYAFKWESSDKAVATVGDGKITAVGAGEAVITVTAGAFKAECKVTVTKPIVPDPKPQPIKVSGVAVSGKTTVTAGQKIALTAAVTPANAANKTVVWSSSNDSVAAVANGVVTAKRAGKVVITASADGKSASVTITVKPKKITKIKVSVKKKKATVKFKAVKGVKKYTVTVYKGKKKIKTATAKKGKITVNKKLKRAKYTVKIRYKQSGVYSDWASKGFKVKK